MAVEEVEEEEEDHFLPRHQAPTPFLSHNVTGAGDDRLNHFAGADAASLCLGEKSRGGWGEGAKEK